MTPNCPKCGFAATVPFAECPQCGIVVAKYLQRRQTENTAQRMGAAHENSELQHLADAGVLKIKQRKEWGEILTGFEMRNRYDVIGQGNNTLLEAEEVSNSLMTAVTRLILKSLRPFTVRLLSSGGIVLYTFSRPFRFYFHELQVHDSVGNPLGTIQRRFSLLRRIYTVLDRNGHELYELFGPILHPWTFEIRQQGRELGKITKKWSGLAQEWFTDADNFGIIYPEGIRLGHKAILLGAVFLIDFVHFEKR